MFILLMDVFQASVPLLLKKISDDLEHIKESIDIVRENPQYMAREFLSAALHKLNSYNFAEVWSFQICRLLTFSNF